MVYTEFLVELDGIYYIDPPPKVRDDPYNEHISTFSQFILQDVWS